MFITAPFLRYIISTKMKPVGFAIDIDGTLTLSHQEIPNSGASQTLNLLTRL
jgi:ribonucleotide monophosphatase NagD (HAD superfamily)